MGPARLMKETVDLYSKEFEQRHGHKPYFSLTPEGARHLQSFLSESAVKNSNYVPVALLAKYLTEELGLPLQIQRSDHVGDEIAKLLGIIVRPETHKGREGTSPKEQIKSVVVDRDVLDFIADPIRHAVMGARGRSTSARSN